MKKIYLLISAAMLSAGAFAQTLTQANHAMSVGNTYSTKQCDSTAINPGGNGVSQTWNYSTIAIHNSTIKNYTAVTVASTGSATAFPSAGVAVSSGPGETSFYSSTANDYKYWGGDVKLNGIGVILSFSNPAIYAKYPMSLLTTTSSPISGSITSGFGSGTFSGNGSFTVTGSGNLNLPGMTFPNVLKVVSTQTLSFVMIISGTLAQVTYDYYSPALSKSPLFSISASTIVTTSASTQTYVTINSNYLTLGIKEQNDKALLHFEAYPNPATDNATISFLNPENESVSYEMMNMAGQTVKTEKLSSVQGSNKQLISFSGVQAGIYFMILRVGDKASVQKITIQ